MDIKLGIKLGWILGFFFTAACSLYGQEQDTMRIFTLEELFDQVVLYHPVALQAGLLDEEARANLRTARGFFDPKLYSEWQQKRFGNEEYFAYGNSGLKIPTWYGLELKTAFQTASGIQLNPEQKLPAAGQAVLGVSAALGRGLWIDERRAALQQARVFSQSNEAERRNMLNDLFMEAAKAYWDWTLAWHQRNAVDRALNLARIRKDGLVESYFQGDKPAIDTLEAFILVQSRQSDLNDAEIFQVNAGLVLSNFLWGENLTPLEISPALRPVDLDSTSFATVLPPLESFVQQANTNHPLLRWYALKINSLNIDRRLAAEQLKPQLNVEYNLLGNGFDFGENPLNDLFLQNYKWGLNFSFPLFLRKERGKLELTRLKIQDAGLELEQKRLEISNKIRQYYLSWENTRKQLELLEGMVNNYRQMLDAELFRFQMGESSIFLINTREQKLLEAQLKRLKFQSDFNKQRLQLDWAAGQLQQ